MSGSPPLLSELFIDNLEAAVPRKPLFGAPYHPLPSVAMVGAYLYTSMTNLALSVGDRAPELIPLVWRHSEYELRSLSGSWNERREARSRPDDGLRTFFLASEYPEVYRFDDKVNLRQLRKSANRHGNQRVTMERARQQWLMWAAEGFALGAFSRDTAERLLAIDYSPQDKAKWRKAHAAGLDIPAEPPEQDRDTDARMLLDAAMELAEHYYPTVYRVIAAVVPTEEKPTFAEVLGADLLEDVANLASSKLGGGAIDDIYRASLFGGSVGAYLMLAGTERLRAGWGHGDLAKAANLVQLWSAVVATVLLAMEDDRALIARQVGSGMAGLFRQDPDELQWFLSIFEGQRQIDDRLREQGGSSLFLGLLLYWGSIEAIGIDLGLRKLPFPVESMTELLDGEVVLPAGIDDTLLAFQSLDHAATSARERYTELQSAGS